MIIKDKIKTKIPIDDWNDYYVVADFDKTITTGKSKTSWSILAGSSLVPKNYIEERDAYYDKYRPIELDETLDPEYRKERVKEWFRLHIELFVKYKITAEIFEKAAKDLTVLEFRKGAKEFIEFLHDKNVPLIIISAGLGNFIEYFLKENDVYYDNVYIASNMIKFTDGVASGVEKNIIHSLNKNEVSLPEDIKEKVENRSKVLLLGDQLSDLQMVDDSLHESVIKIGFLHEETQDLIEKYKEGFDILIEDGESYIELNNKIMKEEN